jgi:NAD-dependent SIR2 family protein deacetylase
MEENKMATIKCLECGKNFERSKAVEESPKFKRAVREMGAMVDQCRDCLLKMARGI